MSAFIVFVFIFQY